MASKRLNAHAKLSLRQVRAIRRLLARGVDQWVIAKRIGISQSTVSQIATGKTWTWVD